MSKYPLLGMTLDELQSVVRGLGMPKFAAKQIASWLYDKKVNSIDEMTNLSLKHREALGAEYEVGGIPPVEAMQRQSTFLMTIVQHFVFLLRWVVR